MLTRRAHQLEPKNILERQAEAFVFKKTQCDADHCDLKNILMVIDITSFSLGEISAVGRSKVDEKTTAQENNDILMVLFHLEQTVGLYCEQVMELVHLEINEKDLEVSIVL